MPQKEQTQSPTMAPESDFTRTVVKSLHSVADRALRINPSMMNTHAGKREQSGKALLVLRCIGPGSVALLVSVLKRLDVLDFTGNLTLV